MSLSDHALPVAAGPPPPGPDAALAPSEPSRLTRWLCATGAVGVCAGALAFVYAVDPNKAGGPYPGCLLKQTTGLDCPGCGGTRAVHALLHGDLAGAADHYALIFVVLPLILYVAVRYAVGQFGVRLPAPYMTKQIGWGVAILFLTFTVVRNIPIGPFYYLNSDLLA